LLRQPDVEFHVLLLNQLVNGPVPESSIWAGTNGDGPDGLHSFTFDEPLFDAAGFRSVKSECARLNGEIESAKVNNDFELASIRNAELDEIKRCLAEDFKHGGTSWGSLKETEKARVAIRKAVVKVFDTVAAVDPYLEGHLRRNVTTGTHCVYRLDPNHPVVWELETGRAA
jgi:hypothetical protein